MRISTTTIEAYRRFMEPDQAWMTEDALLATIRGEFVPTPAVLLGQAFDAVLNDPKPYRVDGGYRTATRVFADAVMTPALDLFDRRGVFQVKATQMYGEHQVVAVADQLVGSLLVENKTTSSAFNFDKYAASCQWRFMADIFHPTAIQYHVFRLGEDTDGITLKSIESFRLYPYAHLHHDCCRLVAEFAAYARSRGVAECLEARQRAATEVAHV